MNHRIIALVSLWLATVGMSAPAPEEEALRAGTQAYVYGLPLVKMYTKRQGHLQNTPVNQFRHLRDVVTPDMGMVAPNADVLYSLAWLDLSREPIVLSIPDAEGRYFSFQSVTFHSDTDFFFSSRTRADKFHHAAYVGPGWSGKLPASVQRLQCSTSAIGLIGRTFVGGTNDLAAARAFQDQFQLTPLSQWQKPPAPAPPRVVYPQFDLTEPLNFFAVLDAALRQNPPPELEPGPVESFKAIGIGGVTPFQVASLDPATRAGLTRALAAGQQLVRTHPPQVPATVGGWELPPADLGRFHTNYLRRAAVSELRLGINSPRECFYLGTGVDDKQQPLQDGGRYRLRFEKAQLPPVKAFWSLTLYQLPERALVANELDRVRLHSVGAGLKYGPDGALEILLQPESPGPDRESNWLPTPAGPFRVLLRLYDPALSILKHEWVPPAVQRLP